MTREASSSSRAARAHRVKNAAAVIGASQRYAANARAVSPDDPLGQGASNHHDSSAGSAGIRGFGLTTFRSLAAMWFRVPRAGIVYVTGAGISQPGGYVLQSHGEQITVLKAVALAHGMTGFAKADNAVIMRNNPVTGQKDMIPVASSKSKIRKTEDVPMKSNDILYIPDSVGKKSWPEARRRHQRSAPGVAIYRCELVGRQRS